MNAKGIATPIPIFAPDERPPVDEGGLGDGVGLDVEPGLTPMTSVATADCWAVNIDVYGAWPEGIVVVVNNVKMFVSWT
jgi:hypothetical protein